MNAHKPTAIYTYLDKIAFWIEHSFSKEEELYIKSQCGPGGTDLDLDKWKRRARFDPRLIQRIETRQPRDELLEFLSHVEGLFFNMAEFALDLIYETEEDRDAAYEYLDQRIVKKGHRGKVRYSRGTRYTDRRWAPTNLVAYRPEFAKLTGEVYCIHLEWRVCGVKALQRMAIDGISDIVDFDHAAFWKKILRLRMFDFARLGRLYSNGAMKKKGHSRKHTPNRARVYVTAGGFKYHTDRSLGHALWRWKETVQSVIDFANERKIPIRNSLLEIDNSAFLPETPKTERRRIANNCNVMSAANANCPPNKRGVGRKPEIQRERL